ncbi:MAG TPA: chemotaxis protein CheX [Dongiaceae bacterium]|nr:chemotaxis protein CheX [Dongiaceae bacterium]
MNTLGTDNYAPSGRQYWAPLLELSAQEVFSLMLGEQLQPAPELPCTQGLDVTSMVGLAGSLCGLMTLRCSNNSAALIASKMLGSDGSSATQLEDAIGEVCNMVAGNFKNKISGLGDGCKLSVPTVITGSNYSLCALVNDCTIEIGLLFQGEPLVISLQLNG